VNTECIVRAYRINGLRGVKTGVLIPSRCFEECLKDLALFNDLARMVKELLILVGEVRGVEPYLSGVAWIGESPICINCDVIEFTIGLYTLKSIKKASQCVFVNNKLIGCRFNNQEYIVRCDCSETPLGSVDYNEVIKVVREIREELTSSSTGNSCFLWIYVEGKLMYWQL